MQKAKKEASKQELPDDLYSEDDRKTENFHKALGVVSAYLMENNKINEFLTFQNKPDPDGYQFNLTVHGSVEFKGDKQKMLENLDKYGEEE